MAVAGPAAEARRAAASMSEAAVTELLLVADRSAMSARIMRKGTDILLQDYGRGQLDFIRDRGEKLLGASAIGGYKQKGV
jgi:hypothetical protein